MNVVALLEKGHSVAAYRRIVSYIGEDKRKFAELMNVFLTGPPRLNQRSSWAVNKLAATQPVLLRPYLRTIITNLSRAGVPDGVRRNCIRVLQFIEIPVSFHGMVTRICFDLLHDPSTAIAIRVFSMTVLANIARKHPALKHELAIIIEDMLPYGSAGIISRGKKTLKILNA